MVTNNPSSTSSEFIVFLDTSLDTHLAVTVCGDKTISELKRILESEHQWCLGRIMIRALKVNWKGHWYLLSDNDPVSSVVNGDNQESFLLADALSLEKHEELQLDIDSKKKSRKKKANDFNGDSLVKSGTEHILGSECDISLAEPQEVVEAQPLCVKRALDVDKKASAKKRPSAKKRAAAKKRASASSRKEGEGAS